MRLPWQAKVEDTPPEDRPGSRGWRGPGGGEGLVVPVDEFRSSSVQLRGLYPFPVGTGTPMIGAPLGRHLSDGGTVCCDEIDWFLRAGLISVPTMWVQAKPGLGKSTLVVRKLICQYAKGHLPLVFGDLKGEYVDLIKALDGQVISLGPGRGYLNILDPGEARAAAKRLTGKAREQVLGDAHTRRHLGVSGLITIAQAERLSVGEESILGRALRVLDDTHDHDRGAPVLQDLLNVIKDGPADVRAVAVDRDDRSRYDDKIENLEVALTALISGDALGDMFSQPTSEPMRRDRPVCFDVSGLRTAGSSDMKAAALVTCWSYGFGSINVSHALADAGLEEHRLRAVVMDELWEVLRVGHGMPGRVDALSRTNRTEAVGLTMITHSLTDLRALRNDEDREMARGLAERAGVVVLGGLPRSEMPMLRDVVGLSRVEENMLVGWQDPPAWDTEEGRETAPAGRGNFLIKVGGGARPGIPLNVQLTSIERAGLHDTSKVWNRLRQVGTVADLPPVDPGAEVAEDLIPDPIEGVPPVPPVRLPGPPVPPPMPSGLEMSDEEVARVLAKWEEDPAAAERLLARLADERREIEG